MISTHANFPLINARRGDAFDLYNVCFYEGPSPYLETIALVFDFALTDRPHPLSIAGYLAIVSDRYPTLSDAQPASYADLFALTVSEVSQLEMNLHFRRWSVTPQLQADRIAVESLHEYTTHAVVYTVWDWFEAINAEQPFDIDDQIENLQNSFRKSIYGGPTNYALLRTAYEKGIPTGYLWDERLIQYGYGCKQVRGFSTTFDQDSHLDSDFTTQKDECKAFLQTLGFPVPQGDVAYSLSEAIALADEIGYPVVVKPVDGHKGQGVTTDISTPAELKIAYQEAIRAIAEDQPIRVLVERSLRGRDFRLLCVNGRFVAALERQPASVVGDGRSTLAALIERENRSPARRDTPTSPLGKIQPDEAMSAYLTQQNLTFDDVPKAGQTVYLRKAANLSAGGLSIDATRQIHPENVVLTQDIAQHFRLTCLGIDVIAPDLAESWKAGEFGIIEMNAAPGIYMHLNPAVGDPVDVNSPILETFFASGRDSRIPIITFNRIDKQELQEVIDRILLQRPNWQIGAVCRSGIFINRAEKRLHPRYNINVQNLLRNPRVHLLIAEYSEATLADRGMFYYGSDLVILDNPTEIEKMLTRDVFEDSTVVIRQDDNISIRRQGLVEQYSLGTHEPFSRAYLKEISTIL
ncbi:MAG: cyanophycin synthetase [Leptolyngbyaceae cyanobacterium SL_1_1]|nr:cyanophycin synthetase [Leptolyngbyaceae cyanobacterium RM1_1_2]NJO10339.1 cyanophycin synthetase [Leptolyngbyaceae cyanobacterium SL_1_1]